MRKETERVLALNLEKVEQAGESTHGAGRRSAEGAGSTGGSKDPEPEEQVSKEVPGGQTCPEGHRGRDGSGNGKEMKRYFPLEKESETKRFFNHSQKLQTSSPSFIETTFD